ncbi:MAG: PleD family two-component system response regulator [Rhodospirillaceae bacterium]|nr:PleD family two-component system response regulator [Rhodospirillaceae bacterium]
MSARILVVDDIPINVRLLQAKLSAEFFDVVTAGNGTAALELIAREPPDLVLLDVMMPGMDGFEVCRRIKADPKTAHIPVVMVTALSDAADRVRGLKAGADDFLTKPINDLALFARVRSLLRLKMMMDEWRLREETCGQFDLLDSSGPEEEDASSGARILVVEDNPLAAKSMMATLTGDGQTARVATTSAEALSAAKEERFDLIMISLLVDGENGLRLCSQFRSQEDTRQIPILLIVDDFDTPRLVKGLDIGANDYLIRPVDPNEMIARVRTQVRRRRYQDRLRRNYERSLSLALTDAVTGLHHRRYMTRHLEALIQRAQANGKSLSVMLFDIDHFKAVNDTYGHDVGDEVLKGVAQRVSANLRNFDMVSRYGGEEFVVVMPDTSGETALSVAERLCQRIAAEPFRISSPPGLRSITVSIGVTDLHGPNDTAEEILKRADRAMYRAKNGGRNRVEADLADGRAPGEGHDAPPPLAQAVGS